MGPNIIIKYLVSESGEHKLYYTIPFFLDGSNFK